MDCTGPDPEGTRGDPVACKSTFVWSRVTNKGTDTVEDATVHYYWINPAVVVDRTHARQIGTSYVTLNPGQTLDVLCLTPWYPVYLNQGHECLIAEAFHPSADPLPSSTNFDVQDRHIAQRNITVINASGIISRMRAHTK